MLALLILLAACSSSSGGSSASDGPTTTAVATTTTAPVPALELPRLRAAQGEDGGRPRFVDADGREVLLRGVNLNFLGDYFQAHPDLPQVVPLQDADWDHMASLGFSVVRLIVSWSFLEPTRGTLDDVYVAKVKAAVAQAKAHGIYVVLDMHQDAWGKYIATPKGTTCPAGQEDNSGWDGAPEWATLTDGKSTCRAPGNRESAPAVQASFNNFYANKDGIQDAFVATWAKLAAAFADDPTIAGYDLLNEPNMSQDGKIVGPQYFALLQHLITAIRAGEAKAGGFDHIIFFEPIVVFPLPNTTPPAGFSDDPNLAFAPHNYWEAITSGIFTIEQGIDVDGSAAKAWNVPYWIGEYGWWGTEPETVAKLKRYAAAEDKAFASGAWWQWKQACGDPHGLSHATAEPPTEVVQLNTLSCPGDKDEGFTPASAAMVSRAYPRAAPGTLTELTSDYDARTMHLAGRVDGAKTDARLQVWVPKTEAHPAAPKVTGQGIDDVQVQAVAGGWQVSATVGCAYELAVDIAPPASPTPLACP